VSHSAAALNFIQLNRIHRQLGELFFRHQEALLDGDLPRAQALWKDYEAALVAHLDEEDQILFPLYRDRVVPPPRGGAPDNFTGEHQKIREWLGRLKLRLSRLGSAKSKNRERLALLDDEAFFKKFLQHHALREDRIFYPALDRVVSDREKAALARLLSFKLEDQETPEEKKP